MTIRTYEVALHQVQERAAEPKSVRLSVTASTGESVSTGGVVSGVLLLLPPHAVKIRDEAMDSGTKNSLDVRVMLLVSD